MMHTKKMDPLAQTKATQARLAALGIIALGPWPLGGMCIHIPIHWYKYAYYQLPATFEHTYPKTPSPQKKRDFKRRIFADLKTTEYDS